MKKKADVYTENVVKSYHRTKGYGKIVKSHLITSLRIRTALTTVLS